LLEIDNMLPQFGVLVRQRFSHENINSIVCWIREQQRKTMPANKPARTEH
jgi:hypothetical protein